jgi:hypothetical protein
VVIVDNASTSEKAKAFLQDLQGFGEYKIKFLLSQEPFTSCLKEGLELITDDSDYLAFSHSDNVVLSKEWLDFLIKQDKAGALCVGPLFNYSGVNGQASTAPNYNFLFTKRSLFKILGRLSDYQNVGAYLDYQYQLQKNEKEVVMVSPTGFLHHFGNKGISKEEKIKDIERFHKNLSKT